MSRGGRGRLWKGTGLFFLILMLAQPQLSVLNAFAKSIPVAESQPPQNPPTPLPPGASSQTVSWNATLYPRCSLTSTTQRLQQVEGSANITVAIPTEIIGSQASGQFITQTYTFYPNGTFSAKDDSENEFSIGSIAGLPAGTMTTSLRANSTEAVQSYLDVAGPRVLANVTVLYTIKQTLCLPSGLKITIVGTSSSAITRIALHFNRSPSSSGKDGAWFADGPNAPQPTNSSGGAPSGTKLGFDWSDSASLNPSYLLSNDTLVYRVGSHFDIDPTVVGTSVYPAATGTSAERKLFHYEGDYLAFYSDGYEIVCQSSPDGSSWSAPSIVASINNGTGATTNLGMWMSGNEIFYALASSGDAHSFQYAVGQLRGACTINWTDQTVPTGNLTASYGTSVVMDSNGTVYVAIRENKCNSCSSYYENVYKNDTDATLVRVSGISENSLILLPLTYGKVAAVWTNPSGNVEVSVSSDGGYSWSAPYGSSSGGYDLSSSSAVSIGDMVYVAAASPTGGYLAALTFKADVPSQGVTGSAIESGLPSISAGITTDGNSFAITYGGGSDVYYTASLGGFSSWSPPALLAGSESHVTFVTSSYAMNNGTFAAMWTSEGSPDEVRFVALPVFVDPAIASPDSWSRPGLSPYESYFAGLSEYVSPGNGLLGVSQQDLSLPGRGIDLDIGRVYTTPYAFDGSSPFQYDNYTLTNLGYGWSLNFPWLGADYLHLTDGQAYQYQGSGSGFAFHGAVDFNFEQIGSGSSATYELIMTSGLTYTFGYQNRSLLSISNPSVDPSGDNVIRFRYGSNGFISQMVDTVGRVVTFSYDSANPPHLMQIASGGRSWTYGYTGNELTSVKDPLGRVTQFSYGGPNGWLLTQVAYPTGGRTDYAYTTQPILTDLTLHQVSLQNVYTTSSNASLTKSTSFQYLLDPDGNVLQTNLTVSDGHSIQGHTAYDFVSQKALSREYDYDSSKNLLKSTETDFDSNGRINETKLLAPGGAVLSTTKDVYDDWGNLIQSTDPYGASVYYSYANTDSQDRFRGGSFSNSFYSNLVPPNIHDALVGEAQYQIFNTTAMETYYKYNDMGYLVQQKESHDGGWIYTSYAYDQFGNLISSTDPLNHTTLYGYSGAYHSAYLTQQSIMVSGKNDSQSFAYAFVTGFQTSVTDGKGNTTSYAYDALGRVTKVTYPTINGLVAKETYSYNDKNDTTSVVDENRNLVKEYFDGLGRETAVTDYNGSVPYSSVLYSYNWQNQVVKETTPAGDAYLYSYDYLGRPIGTVNPDFTFTSTYYDVVNDVVTTVDENGHQTQTLLDRDGRTVGVNQFYSATQYYSTRYTYDNVGNLLTVEDGKYNITTYQYDDLSRLVLTIYPDHTTQSETYDNAGNVQTTTDQNGNTVTNGYDELGRLTSITFPNSTQLLYSYDANGNLLKMTYPAQSGKGATDSTSYTYDARDRMTSQSETIDGKAYTMSYSYDAVGNVVSTKYPDGSSVTLSYDSLNRLHKVGTLATFTYTLDDQVATIKYGDGQTQSYTYNSMDEPKEVKVQLGAVKQLDLNYSYDNVGNVKTIGTESYGYDWLDRLTSASGPWVSITYTYDPVGNRLTMVQGGTKTSYSYNDVNELTKAGKTTYSYDNDGNLFQEVSGGTTWRYGYDYEDQLISVTKVTSKSSSVVQRNVYDGTGLRVKMTEGSTSTIYMYEGTDIVYYKTGSTATKMYYADGMEIGSTTGSTTYYDHADVLGSIRLESTSAGGLAFSSNYEPYGPQYGSTGSDPFMYTGKLYDTNTNLYYSGTRYYDPNTGRFITKDPSSGSVSDPQSLNAYTYAEDNPLNNIDPTGQNAIGDAWNWIASHASTLLLAGAIVGLTAISSLQLGLDPVTDALDAGAVADLAGDLGLSAAILGASAVGLPVVFTGVTVVDMDLTPAEMSLLEQASTARDRTIMVRLFLEKRLPGGSEVDESMPVAGSWRLFDIKYIDEETDQWRYVELKNSGDPVSDREIARDLVLQKQGVKVEYIFTRTEWGKWSEGDISQIDGKFPYRLYNLRRSWTW